MLKVWLPLNGNLDNKGCTDITVTGTDVTVNNSGKTGKCYSFNGSSSYIMGSAAPLSSTNTEWSYCCWFKPINQHTGCLFSNRTMISNTGIAIFYYNSHIYFDDGVRWDFEPSTAITVGQWNHLAFTRSSGKKCFYLNGVLVDSTTTVGTLNSVMNSTRFAVGMSQNSSTSVSANPLYGYLNDVRIYDECLSAEQISRIARAKVLHYPLGGIGNPNLIKNSANLTVSHLESGNEYVAINVGNGYMNIDAGT